MSNLHRVAIADIYLLSADEVRYEIWMRSGQSADLLDAHQARERLRTILAVEKIEPSMTSVAADVVIPDLQKEVQTIEQKIRKQREVVERFSDKSHSKSYRKCFAKLNHVWNRINIIPADNNQLRLDLHKEVMDLHWLLESKASVSGSDVEQSSGDEYVDAELPSVSTQRPPLPAMTSSSPNTSHARADTLINEMENTVRRVSIAEQPTYMEFGQSTSPGQWNSAPPPNRFRSVTPESSRHTSFPDLKLYKWGIKYSGDDAKQSLSVFLSNLQDRCQSRNVSPNQLLGNCADLFEGSAKAWYHAFGRRIRDWDEFVRQLKQTFLDSDYDYRLKEEIRQRKQGPDETITIFISKMINLFDMLSRPLSQLEQLEIVEHNILPNYQRSLAFSNHRNLEELLQFLLRLEVGEARASRMQGPPSRPSTLEPHMQHRNRVNFPSPAPPVRESFPRHARLSEISQNPSPAAGQCWNCGGPHRFRQCNQAWSLFCHGCGMRDVRSRTCPRCSGNGRRLGARAVPPSAASPDIRSSDVANPGSSSQPVYSLGNQNAQ
ncbi:hypothetical protein M8J77_007841 [Diaphorina citri]|nr:hypothetical protein M8J77_007841 [Diaphorina citri]